MADSDMTTAASSEQVPTPAPQDPPKVALDEISSKVWPPNQRTRDEVSYRLFEALSTPSALSKSYGIIPCDEASAIVDQFEKEAFAAADAFAASNGDGMEILRVYSKEISKRILETFMTRTATGLAAVESGADQPPPSSLTTTEDVPAATESDT